MRVVGLFLLWLALAAPAAAKTTVAEMRERMVAGDIAAVEAMFAAAHHSPETEAGDYSEQRGLFDALAVSDPRALDFVDAWLKSMPDSPYAHTAKAWQLTQLGGWVRGESVGNWTYTDAAAAWREMGDMAAQHALAAYTAAPDLVAASDMVLIAGRKTGLSPEKVLEDVMTLTPNSRSIRRAVSVVAPQWGGSVSNLEHFCTTYAPKVRDIEGYDRVYCMVETAIKSNFPPQYLNPIVKILDWAPDPKFDALRVARTKVWWSRPPDTGRPAVAAYLDLPETTDIEVAKYFDGRSRVLGEPLRGLIVTERRIAEIKGMIEFDPYNPDLLQVLATKEVWQQGPVADPPSDEEVFDLLRRGLVVAPFDSDIWRQLAFAKLYMDDVAAQMDGEALFENAIAYANHRPDLLGEYGELQDMRMMSHGVSKGVTWGEPITADALDPDMTRLMCLTVRIGRIYEAICNQGAEECSSSADQTDRWAQSAANAEALGICEIERNSPVEALGFMPRAVPGVPLPE